MLDMSFLSSSVGLEDHLDKYDDRIKDYQGDCISHQR